jgi:hypothetical protein
VDRERDKSLHPVQLVDPLEINTGISTKEKREIFEVGHGNVDEVIFREEGRGRSRQYGQVRSRKVQ